MYVRTVSIKRKNCINFVKTVAIHVIPICAKEEQISIFTAL
jgi:hypothetical protein